MVQLPRWRVFQQSTRNAGVIRRLDRAPARSGGGKSLLTCQPDVRFATDHAEVNYPVIARDRELPSKSGRCNRVNRVPLLGLAVDQADRILIVNEEKPAALSHAGSSPDSVILSYR